MQWNQVANQLRQFSQTDTIRDSFITVAGTSINGILGLVYFFFLASKLLPGDYGKFSIAVALTMVGFSVFSFGLEQSIIKFHKDTDKLSNIVLIRLITAILVSAIPLLIFKINNIFILVGIGIGSKLLFSLSVTFLQSWQKYPAWSIYFIATNLFRLLLSYFVSSSDPYLHFAIYSLVPAFGFLAFVMKYHLPKISFNLDITKSILSFNLPLSKNSMISSINSKTDSFFIAGFQGFATAGLYDLSVQISSSISQLVTAYSAAIAPKYSSLDSNDKNKLYLTKNIYLSTAISLLLIPALLLLGYLLFNFSGKDFSQSFLLLLLLLLGNTIFFASVPLRDSLLYYFGDSKIFSYLSTITLLISILSGFLLIRPFGPIAAAGSFLAIQIISVIILVVRFHSLSMHGSRSHKRI